MTTGCSERAWIEHIITVLGCNFMKVVNGPRVGGQDVITSDRCDIVRETGTDIASHSSPLCEVVRQEDGRNATQMYSVTNLYKVYLRYNEPGHAA
jgi:hypothetical protein